MAEIFGAVASASQLAVMTMGLLNTIKKIKAGSKTLKRYQQQLQEVQVLSETISRNPLLQTPDVDYHTRSILVNISQNNLEHRLQRGWLSRTYTFLYKDRDLVEFFIILDRQKSSLSLVIENIQSRALHQIQSDIRAMCKPSPPFENPSTPPDSETETSPISSPKYTEPKSMDRSSKSSAGRDQTRKNTKTSDRKPESDIPQGTYTTEEAKLRRDMEILMEFAERWQGAKGSHWHNCVAGNGVSMQLGPLIDASLIDNSPEPFEINPSSFDTYTGCTSVGTGNSNQGVQVEYSRSEDLNQNKFKRVQYNAYFRGNNTGPVKDEDIKAGATGSTGAKMHLGTSHVFKETSNAVPQSARERTMVSAVEGMVVLDLGSNKVKDQANADK
ncbi:hypothetical protein F5X68DRAFT_15224 [Plectosphaerella plurivora]|uniref:Fungal N-terminal domain-containing protein n=1 Tax=Plectosphaerella plurivora TaxID=936078 RepID=A0A9P8VAN9_9PEZI|nr:hypothetical protein F5X68DRAFT_15224 [Plectosphaerella plurivora]